jgi:phosphoglucosamine mutase
VNVRYAGASPLIKPVVTEAIAAEETALGARGRVLIRASGTEPVIRVMAEAEDEATVERVVDDLCRTISHAVALSAQGAM